VGLVLVLLLAELFLGTISTQSAEALGVGSLSILPSQEEYGPRSWFVHTLSEGEEGRDEMTISNDKDESVTVLIFPSGYSTKDSEIIKDDLTDSLRQEPGHWVELDKTEATIPSHSSTRVGFTIKVPENANVGEHVGGVFVQEIDKSTAAKATGVKIRLHIGARMVINVPGDVERSLTVSNIRHAIDYTDNRALRFIFTLENQGNVAIGPVLDTEISGTWGKVDEQIGNQLQVVARNETKDVESKWLKSAPYIGRFVAKFKFHLGEREQFNKDGTRTMLPDEVVEATYVFWLFPLAELIYLLTGIFILYLLRSLWLYTIITRRLRTKSKLYKVVKNDTLTSVASKFGVDPRVLAKFNMMRWPYELKTGDELLIPVGRMDKHEWREQSKALLGNKEILGGIFGSLFRRHNVHGLVDKVRGGGPITTAPKQSQKGTVKRPSKVDEMVALTVDRGDTIQDVADFVGVSVEELIAINRLKAPYRLRAGQELLAPRKKSTERRRK